VRTELFDYELPPELIAQEPVARRDASRLMVVDRGGEAPPLTHLFADLPGFLSPGDLVVLNDAKVHPARLWARRATGGIVEILVLRPLPDAADAGPDPAWEALVRPGKRVRQGEVLALIGGAHVAGPRDASGAAPHDEGADTSGGEDGASSHDIDAEIRILGETGSGRRRVAFPGCVDVVGLLEERGNMPLPPYIRRDHDDLRGALDRERYQTVYAMSPGAVAAPTAGLHFTAGLLDNLHGAGIETTTLTLDVGPGTFQPVRVDEVTEHSMESEEYELPAACVQAISSAKQRGGRVVAVGTTVVRTLEHASRVHGDIESAAGPGSADVFIFPGFEFRVVDAMLTNFHLPRSTPILMASALAGRERLLAAYDLAVREGFRFYSYGDAMLIR